MQQALLVTVRFHHGRYHGRDDRQAPEWPPSPARVFQALLAGAARGHTVSPSALDVLDWLETLAPPLIAAPRGIRGQGYVNFVPNNDLDAKLSKRRIDQAVALTRVGKQITPTVFNNTTPVLYCWSFANDDENKATKVCALVHEIYQVGRGVDMAWADGVIVPSREAMRRISEHRRVLYRPTVGGHGIHRLLCPVPGSRRSLTARYQDWTSRLRVRVEGRKRVLDFVQPPRALLQKVAYEAQPYRLVFGLREPSARSPYAVWPLTRTSKLVETARDMAASHLRLAIPDLERSIERYLIGRAATNADKASRVHIIPIPSVGHEHADFGIRRLLVIVPQTCPLAPEDIAWAFSQVSWCDDDGVVIRELHRMDDDRMVQRFEQVSRHWKSVTPLALTAAGRRRIDPIRQVQEAKGGVERAAEEAGASATVIQALRHAQVSLPATEVLVQREPLDRRGARAERFAHGTRFAKQVLWHVAFTFSEPVSGPMLLGDGRFLGLGLMRPDDPLPDLLALRITGGLTDHADSRSVAYAARRAMMARVQAILPRHERLPTYVSGHLPDGRPVTSGVHRHLAVVADLPRHRILYIAPNRLQRSGVRWRTISANHRLVADAIVGMDTLRAGRAGRLTLTSDGVYENDDALFAPSRSWESVTAYHVTRHRRGIGESEALTIDLASELDRIGWPRPESIEVLVSRSGARGRLSGRLRIRFRTAQRGPLLIGQTAHKGGGLFVGS